MTVVWLRPPNARPIAGSVWSVSSRARYMATCRGQATGAARLVERSWSIETPNASQIRSWMSCTDRRRGCVAGIEAGEHLVGELGGDRAAGERAVGDDADQRALERADVGVDALGDQVDRDRIDACQRVLLHALAQDRPARGEVGRADVGHQAGLEPLAQAVLECVEVAREAIGREDELGAGAVQRVEGVEELLLGARLALQELDVVDEQDVDAAICRLERLERPVVQRADELVGERLGGRVEDGRPRRRGR